MSRSGLTLAELIVAFGLLALLFVGCAVLFTSLLASNQKTNSALAGLSFANARLEEMAESGSYINLQGSQSSYVMDASQGTQFFFLRQCEPLSADLTSSSPFLGGYLVTMDVWWNVDSPVRLVPGQGLRSVRIRRFFYPQVVVP